MLRIKELREARRLNMKEAAHALNLAYTTYVNYEKGFREPTSEVLILLADFYETTVDYIVGRNTQRSSESFTGQKQSFDSQLSLVGNSSTDTLTEEEGELIRKYRCLDQRGKSAVRNVLEYEYQSLPGDTASPAPKKA